MEKMLAIHIFTGYVGIACKKRKRRDFIYFVSSIATFVDFWNDKEPSLVKKTPT